ncbi:MAG: SEC-C domain-containing protein, partial [Burkholderiaceae bacterium]|nr:SEC-C domain-containing protein [Burkholderiaceae bacterium]
EQWDIPGLEKALEGDWQIRLPLSREVEAASAITGEDVAEKVVKAANDVYAGRVALVGAENFRPFERAVLLQAIDTHWREHLSALDYLRQGIHLRGYAQKQPKQEYKREAFELFGQLLDIIKNDVTRTLMTIRIQTREEMDEAAQAVEQSTAVRNITYIEPDETGSAQAVPQAAWQPAPATATAAAAASTFDIDLTGGAAPTDPGGIPRVGRNDPCPCGSGKKYKFCHGALN